MSGGDDQTIKIWNYETYEEVRTLTGHTDWVCTLCHIKSTKLILSGGRDYLIKLWDIETFKLIHTFVGHNNTL